MGKVILNSGLGSGSDDCSSTKAHLLEGYTAITGDSNDEPIGGTMKHRNDNPTSNALKVENNLVKMYAPSGYYDGVNDYVWDSYATVASRIGLTSGVLRAGYSILGINGDPWIVWTGDCTADVSQVLSGKTYWQNGVKKTGTIPNHAKVKTKCNNIWWRKDNDDALSIAVEYGYYECYWAENSYEYIEGSALRNALGVESWKFRADQTIAGINGGIQSLYANVPGTTDRIYATNSSNWEGTINVGIKNGYFLNGVNWVQYDMPNYYAKNIREGVNMGGVVGTMKDYSYLATSQVAFNGASFSGVLEKGAASYFMAHGNPDTTYKNPLTITLNGIEIKASKNKYTYSKFCSNYAVNLTPFKTIRVWMKMLTPRYNARAYCKISVYKSDFDRVRMFKRGMDIPGDGGASSETELPWIGSNPNYVPCDLNVSAINHSCFITICPVMLNGGLPVSEGFVYAINKIELIA